MPLDALLLVLCAATVHAAWNLLLGRSDDPRAVAAVAVAVGAVLFAPVAALDWRMDAAALPYVAASSALELAYLGLLATAYAGAQVGFVYPVARGSAPVIVLAVSVAVLGARPSAGVLVGLAVVVAGIVLVRGLRSPARRRDLVLALGIGACIAAYTLVDQRGIRHASAPAYLELVFGATAIAAVLGAARTLGSGVLRVASRPATVAVGAGFFGSYALTLAALRLAPAASVAAVRETSVVIAVLALAALRVERLSRQRLCGACAVAAGVALIALG